MNLNIAATKTNLLKVKKFLAFTREGHELLDEKRKILINELNSIIDITEKIENDLDAMLRDAYAVVDKAVIVMGRTKVEGISCSMDIKSDLEISHRRIMGVEIPIIKLKITDNSPHHSPYEVSFYVDEAVVKFKEALETVAQLAEKKIALLRIAEEAFKTIRKVNALEKVYIPDYQDTLKYISERLDEEGRESFSMLKIIKSRLRG